MIRFLIARGSEYVVNHLIHGKMGSPAPPCAAITYDRFLARRETPAGVYIFTDFERLTPWELRLAAEAFGAIAGDPRCRALNDPARVMTRYELLRRLRLEGINDFDVIRADEGRRPARYPVFLRNEQDHGRPLSDLIQTPEALEQALCKLRDEHIPLRGVLIVEYAAESFDPPFFRKYNTFRVGPAVFAHHIVTENSWCVKYGLANTPCPEEYRLHERAFVDENRYADLLTRVFEISAIEYGRADFGLVGGRPQIYEINTNPYLSCDPGTTEKTRCDTVALVTRKFLDSLGALDPASSNGHSGGVALHGSLLDAWRAEHKWYERPEKRP